VNVERRGLGGLFPETFRRASAVRLLRASPQEPERELLCRHQRIKRKYTSSGLGNACRQGSSHRAVRDRAARLFRASPQEPEREFYAALAHEGCTQAQTGKILQD